MFANILDVEVFCPNSLSVFYLSGFYRIMKWVEFHFGVCIISVFVIFIAMIWIYTFELSKDVLRSSLNYLTLNILIRPFKYFGPTVWYRLQRTTSALQVKKKASVFLLSRYKTWERPLGVFLLRNLESSKKCVASFRRALTEFFTPIRTGGVQTDSKGSIQIFC